MGADRINPVDQHPRRHIKVLDTDMSFVDTGRGHPIVFLHGNPTWSYLWRNIVPFVGERGRCLAPDLVGMGQSSKLPSRSYRFFDHARYLDAWFDLMESRQNVTLVLHDWGSALGFYWAFRDPERVRAIAYMEAIVQPRRWGDFPAGRGEVFKALRSNEGERLILDENFFVETFLPKSVLRELGKDEMQAYRSPYHDRESRLPMLQWPREMPIDGEPADVASVVDAYGKWLAQSNNIPKLFIAANPGAIVVGRARDFCCRWPNQREIEVAGIHFVQEDAPAEIGAALARFLRDLEARKSRRSPRTSRRPHNERSVQ
jgi:haloalkane dehalogenase